MGGGGESTEKILVAYLSKENKFKKSIEKFCFFFTFFGYFLQVA